MNKDELIKAIKNISDKELAEIFYEAFKSRKKIIGKEIDGAIIIGESAYSPYDKTHYTEFWALPVQGLPQLKHLGQQGKCENCQALVCSVAKEAICPICSTVVECT